LVMASGIPRYLSFTTIKHLLLEGKPAGRREAARALAGFNGSDANALALRALEDADPQVQANILSYIRQRAIPGILPRLVKFMDSPHLVVRRAVQQSLADFSFPKFLNSFEMLDEDVQQSTGMLVKKVDPQTLPLLREELLSPSRSRRIKGLKIASALDLIESLETTIRDLMRDSDPEIRFEAALALDNRKPPSNSHPLEEFPFDNDYQPQENGLEDA
jgi:HEAT repeat protein